MPSRHGSVQSLNSPPQHSLAYLDTMHEHPVPAQATQHPSLADFHRYVYDTPAPQPSSSYVQSPMQTMATIPQSMASQIPGAVRPKRKQVKNACMACQRACKRCDVGRPCERCIKYGMADSCRDSQRKERKKGVKRGPYKKRDGMLNELQRMASPKRMSRVPSGELSMQSTPSMLPQMDPVQAIPLQLHSVPSVRPSGGDFPYSTAVMVPATHTPPQSLAAMPHPSPTHATFHHNSSTGEDQFYQPRYDHLTHGSARSTQAFRMDATASSQQDYSTRHVSQMQEHRSPMRLQYPSPDNSPSRDRQYSTMYADNSSNRHSAMMQGVHHDVSYQSQSDVGHEHESPPVRAVDHYSYSQHQHQRSYSADGHMAEVHQEQQHQQHQQQQHQQQHQQQQQSYYSSGYNSYQQSSSYSSSHSYSGYSQHVPQQMTENDANGYHQMNRMAPDHYASTGSSINSYPTQHSQHQMNGVLQPQYSSIRTPAKMMHRDSYGTGNTVAHHYQHQQHVGNVQIQSN